MPDTLPPPGWGPAPFDDRDLDAVLAGDTADIPVALRPVADALAALRAAPAPAELRGETSAMAEFRAHSLGLTGRSAGLASTLVLSAVPTDPARQRPARHRARRRASNRAGLRTGVLTAIAAAAALVVAALFTGSLPGPIERMAGLTRTPTASTATTHSAGNSSSRSSEATSASPEPSAPASPSAPATSAQAQQASSTCSEFYSYYKHPVAQSDLQAEMSQWQQLTKLADSRNPRQVYQYCARYVPNLPGWNPALYHTPPPAASDQGRGHLGQIPGGQQPGDAGGQQNG